MNTEGIPVNIWDDYVDDGYNKAPQETYAYVEDVDIPEATRAKMLDVVMAKLRTLDMTGVDFKLHGDQIWFVGLTHVRREKLVDELQAANLEFKGRKFSIYSES